ncbi:DUF4349 domain-containing protein [Synechococcus elongatus IITB4]|uniref:DUF4349 domain-containing protein n=1 Tax=Synechococcus elongatus TaxID=32046 RepID=UPI0030CE5118
MKRSLSLSLVTLFAASGALLGGCAEGDSSSSVSTVPSASTPALAVPEATQDGATNEAPRPAAPRPQLAKTATMRLAVTDIREAVQAAEAIVRRENGDVLQQNETTGEAPSATLQARIPADRLDAAIAAFRALGRVDNVNVQAEDVARQLTDLQARLSNLERTERALQSILDRATKVEDVLKITERLSSTREQIEQLKAEQLNLRTRVAYSTITLQFQPQILGETALPAFAPELETAWRQSSQSVLLLVRGLLVVGVWVLAYSPLFLILIGGGYGLLRYQNRSAQRRDRQPPQEPQP